LLKKKINCPVLWNCKKAYKACWVCSDFSEYRPVDSKFKSPRQLADRVRKREERKTKKNSACSKIGKRSKRKGYLGEKEMVDLYIHNGLEASRQPSSGAWPGKNNKGDVLVEKDWVLESKRRKTGFKMDYEILKKLREEVPPGKFVAYRKRCDNEEGLITIYEKDFIRLLKIEKEYLKQNTEDKS